MVNCTPSIQRRAKRSMPTTVLTTAALVAALAAMVKFRCEPTRIKQAPCPAEFEAGMAPRVLPGGFRPRPLAGSRLSCLRAAELRHRDARRAGAAGRLRPYALCQSRCTQGWPPGAGPAWHFRQPQSLDRQG